MPCAYAKQQCHSEILYLASYRHVLRYAHLIATAAASAPACAICAIDTMFLHALLPSTGFSGTTIVSPGPIVAESAPPDQRPCFPPVTEPSERIMNIPRLSASCVGPPARERYQPAFLPGA